MIKRTISGITASIILAVALIFNQSVPMIFNVLISISCCISMYELFLATNILTKYYITVPSLIFTLCVPLLNNLEIICLLLYTYTFLVFIIMILCNKKINFKEFSVSYAMTLIITFSLNCLLILRNSTGNKGTFYIILTLTLAWMTDTGAYFGGSFLGKHKLCPVISPKKTIEGALCGVIVAVISVFFECLIFERFLFDGNVSINYINLLVLVLIGSVISMFGDLSFSLIKRICSIKDFGNFLPGHGGILDRLDSIIFLTPYVYFLIKIMPIVC